MTRTAAIVTPMRFVAGVVGLWTAARLALLLPFATTPALDTPVKAGIFAAPQRSFSSAQRAGHAPGTDLRPIRTAFAFTPSPLHPRILASANNGPVRLASAPPVPVPAAPQKRTPDASDSLSPTGLIAPATNRPATSIGSRWSGSAYLFRRGDGGTPSIASGGQLGGSQAGARIAYSLDHAGRLAAAARISSPLEEARGAEAALGLDWHPLPSAPMRVSIERRVDLGGSGRNAWSAYAAGGFWRQSGRLVLDGYAQAGVVGARQRDLFADGAMRAGLRSDYEGRRSLTVGAGAWAAAQPRVTRIDVGPRVALGLPVGGTAATIAAEWRVRVAGDAAPGTGLAITLAADF